jgi:hypothetical protein
MYFYGQIMHNNNKMVDSINTCLKKKSNANWEYDPGDIYSGLADLCAHFTLENQAPLFFDALDQLSALSINYCFGDDPLLDGFIIQLENILHPKKSAPALIQTTPWWEIEKKNY